MEMMKTIAKTSWEIVCACDSATQPVALFGGDFNCTAMYSAAGSVRGCHLV